MTTVVSFEVSGLDRLDAALRASPEQALKLGGIALWNEANRIITVAKGETPVDKGILRASGGVQEPVYEGTAVTVTLGFGGAAQAYAVLQHETTTFNHRVGKDHFLSDPMLAAVPGMEERLAVDIHTSQLFQGLI